MTVNVGARVWVAGLLAVTLAAVACSSSGSKSGALSSSGAASGSTTTGSVAVAKPSRGFDGTTIKVAGLGLLSSFAGADVGTEARFMRANDTNELNGIKLQFVEFADDQGDPAVALSEARRLVTQDQVFAIVPDLSPVNPGAYLTSQQVPWVGYAFDGTYCSTSPSTSLWGFGFDGCLVPTDPPYVPDSLAELYKYISAKTGKTNPTAVLFSNDDQSGANSTRLDAVAATGAGFKVVYAQGTVPMVVSDYTPYVQQWFSADGGKQPDVLVCLLAVQCVGVWEAVKAEGFTGTFFSTLGGVAALAKAFSGTVTESIYNTQPNPGLTQMEADLQAFKPGTQPVGYSNVPAYFAADMFIQALKKVGRDITPRAVQQALATQTWSIPGLVGPTDYPASTVGASPACSELLLDDGTNYNIVEPYACSTKTFPVTGG
jgi:ABC-type branched-subunit amino acid transport system substrate-binding protein